MIAPAPVILTCSICGEPSTDICVYCTKDACTNHRCDRCKRCSDCCECDVPLSAKEPSVFEPEAAALPVTELPAIELPATEPLVAEPDAGLWAPEPEPIEQRPTAPQSETSIFAPEDPPAEEPTS